MGTSGKITILQLFLLTITTLSFQVHVLVLDPLLTVAGRDAWISHLFNCFIMFFWAFLLYYIIKGLKQIPLSIWLEQQIGKIGKYIFSIFMYISLLILSTNTLKLTISWAQTNFLETTPPIILYLTFISICLFATYYGLRALGIANVFLLTFVIFLGVFIGLVNIPRKDFSYLLPVFKDGVLPSLMGTTLPFFSLMEVILIILLSHRTKTPFKLWHIVLLCCILALIGIGPTIASISEFGIIEARNQSYSAYEQWGIGELGKFITHLDFGSIFQWMAGVFIRISLVFIVIEDFFNPKTKKQRLLLNLFTSASMLGLALLPISNITYQVFYQRILLPTCGLLFASCTIFVAILVFIANRKDKKHHVQFNTE